MRTLLSIFCAVSLSSVCVAQSNYGSVSGTVRDSQSLAVAHATVNFKALSTGTTRSVATNDSGIFYAAALLPDDYDVTTTASGFAPITERVHVEVGQKLALEIALKVGALREGVDVTSAGEILHTTDAAVGEVVEPKSIQELPLNGRMLIDLVLTVPGAHVGFGAQTGQTNPLYWRPGQRSAVVIGGARSNANFFLLDGATNTDPTFNTQNLSPSPDSVMEFQVVTSSYTADMGGAGGGQVNIVTRSGTNTYHGTVYEFLRNGAMDASPLLSLPTVKQRQAGIPQMNLRNWGYDGYAEDSWQFTPTTTINLGVRYEYTSPLYDLRETNSNLVFNNGVPSVFIGGENGYPTGLLYSNKHDVAPRVGIAKNLPRFGLVLRGGYGIFFTPVDQNTWCNQRHNVPFVFPETQQADNFTPPAALFANTLNFGTPVLGTGTLPATTVSFTAFDSHAPAEYIQQWNGQIEKALGPNTMLEVGYLGARGFHLQRSHLINNAPPGPGPLGPRRPFKTLSFVPGTTLTPSSADAVIQSQTFPVSTINLLEDTAQSWYDAGYINVRRKYSHGLSFLVNYTLAKNLTNAPDFRSPMDESAIPQNNSNLAAEKGPGCDVRHRLALSAVYNIPAFQHSTWTKLITQNWQFSTLYQAQSGMPFTVSVFGDTANSGTVLGENPVRANYTGQPVFGPGTRTANEWFNPAAFATPAAFTFGNAGRNSVYGPPLQTLDLAVVRSFRLSERASFEFRGEAFNALNMVNLGTPNRFVNTPQFGTITMAMTPGRELQMSARVSF